MSICNILGSNFGSNQGAVTVTLQPQPGRHKRAIRNKRTATYIHFDSTQDEYEYLEKLFKNKANHLYRTKRGAEILNFASYEQEEQYLEDLVFESSHSSDDLVSNLEDERDSKSKMKRNIPNHEETTDDEYEFLTDLFLQATGNKKIKGKHDFFGSTRKRRALLGGSGSTDDLESLVRRNTMFNCQFILNCELH